MVSFSWQATKRQRDGTDDDRCSGSNRDAPVAGQGFWRIREVVENLNLACQVPDRFLTGSGFQCVVSRDVPSRSLRFVN